MTSITIQHSDLTSLAGRVIIVTGGSSGIGLAAVTLLLELGAKVVNGDLNVPPSEHSNLSFVKTDVSSWSNLVALFKHAVELYSRVDHVFANAGIGGTADYLHLQSDPSTGDPLEPSQKTFDVDLKAVVNTSALAVHYMQHQEPPGGSIVCTGSASSFQRFRMSDYCTAKHGVLGLVRGLTASLDSAGLPIRVNCVAPSWTVSGLLPPGMVEMTGTTSQTADVVARSVALLMVDHSRQGQMIYSCKGKYTEIEHGVLFKAVGEIVGDEPEEEVFSKLMSILATNQAGGQQEK